MKALLWISVLLGLAGCGVLSHGTSQSISCTTIPAGALVRSADGTTCSTPCTVSLKRKKDDILTIERDGYETVTLPVHSVFSGASARNILLPGGLICWGLDVVSGGGYDLVPAQVAVTLKPLAGETSQVAGSSRKFSVIKRLEPIFEEELN